MIARRLLLLAIVTSKQTRQYEVRLIFKLNYDAI